MKYLLLIVLSAMLAGCTKAPSTTTSQQTKPFEFVSQSKIEMVFLPGGTFAMGSDQGEEDERPQHSVSLTAFAMDRTEVTHAMFTQFELPNPSKWQDDPSKPVNQVRWRDAKVFCNERSIADGLEVCYDESVSGWPCDFSKNGYRLPTEAEWEYAARGGTKDEFPGGGESKLANYAWFDANSAGSTHPVASRRPNAWGLHGMYGNVSEWCHDVYQADYYATSVANDPTGPISAEADAKRVVRGGSWKATGSMCRVCFRQGKVTGDSDACFASDDCGFRCVRRIAREEAEQHSGL